jgi:hypothetical protein
MSSSVHPLSSRLQELLEVVDQDREKRCAELIDQARADAERIVKQAWKSTRARLHHEVLHARQEYRRQLLLEQASNEARRRQARERVDRAWLDQVWQPLQEALVQRWQTTEGRLLWVDALMRQATGRLVQSDWQIHHPADWPEAERRQLATRLQAVLGKEPAFVADPALSAGIRVCAGHTVVDGSCAGLLRDRTHIEALLLAALRESDHG